MKAVGKQQGPDLWSSNAVLQGLEGRTHSSICMSAAMVVYSLYHLVHMKSFLSVPFISVGL